MKINGREFTAVHEAGHVVAWFALAEHAPAGFEYVTIKPDEESEGHVKGIERFSGKEPGLFSFLSEDEANSELSGFTQQQLEAEMSISLAGEAAT